MNNIRKFKKALEDTQRLPPMLKTLTLENQSGKKDLPDISVSDNTSYNTRTYMCLPHHKAISKMIKT